MARNSTMTLLPTIEEYRLSLTAMGKAHNTIRQYMQTMNAAKQVWGDIPVAAIQSRHISAFFAEHAQWKASTRNNHLQNLNVFFDWCKTNRIVTADFSPTHGWRNVRVPEQEHLRIPLAQFPDLLDNCMHPRDRAVCAIGLFLFLRGGEISTLRVKDYDEGRHLIRIERHKTAQVDSMPVSTELAQELAEWFEWYKAVLDVKTLNPEWFLVPTLDLSGRMDHTSGKRLFIAGTALPSPTRPFRKPYQAVQKSLARLGYDTKGTGEHTLRRSGARALFDELRGTGFDGALMIVSSMLFHKNTKITEHYLGLSLERTKRNEKFAGETMFASLRSGKSATVIPITRKA